MDVRGDHGVVSARAVMRWQFRLAHDMLDRAFGALSDETVHRRFPGDAVPAGASYAHVILSEDVSVNGVLTAAEPLALSTWMGRTGVSEIPPFAGPTDWLAWARRVRIDAVRLRAYARAVYASTDSYLATLPDQALDPSGDEVPARVLSALLMALSMRRGEIACLTALYRAPVRGE